MEAVSGLTIAQALVACLSGMLRHRKYRYMIPLMLTVLRLPTRVVIGSSLGIVFISSMAGFAGKLATGQMPLLLAAAVIAGAFPGAQLGAVLSRRTRPKWLRLSLAVVVAATAVKIGLDVAHL